MKSLEWKTLRGWLLVGVVAFALVLASCGSEEESKLPEIEIRDDAGNLILSTDVVDFGAASQCCGHATLTFIIYNKGEAQLTISGSPTIGGTDPTFWLVTTAPDSSLGSGGSTPFALDFPNDMDFGVTKTATVTISSNDADEGTFTFGVTGVANS